MLLFRVDDFPLTKPEESWRHNLDNFKRFNDLMQKHGVEYVLGVIPRHTSDDQLRFLSEQQNIEVALHGINHDERFQNEFQPHQTQKDVRQALSSAVRPLNEICGPIDSYIPPHNVIDPKTVLALKDLGFKKIFGGPGMSETVFEFVIKQGLDVFYSSAPLQYGRSDELLERGSIPHLKAVSRVNDVYLTLHWTWEWNIGLENLDRYLTELKS